MGFLPEIAVKVHNFVKCELDNIYKWYKQVLKYAWKSFMYTCKVKLGECLVKKVDALDTLIG